MILRKLYLYNIEWYVFPLFQKKINYIYIYLQYEHNYHEETYMAHLLYKHKGLEF